MGRPPDDAAAAAIGDQYLWGRDILVAPVVEQGAASRRVYLPRGEWYDFWTNTRVTGGREVDRAVDLETMPLYVRAGAVIPMGPVKQYADEPSDAPLALVVYPGADGAGSMYDDDGISFAHRRGDFTRLAMAWTDRARTLTLRLAPDSAPLPAPRPILIRVAGGDRLQRTDFTGRELTLRL